MHHWHLSNSACAASTFVSMKQENDKRIGDLTIGDFLEMCGVLSESEDNDEND
ncbi:hypothetical protein FACS1894126_4790 [Alphaproteobacteria bacterium]|nr:hypothetical protein FACS1894126_4790 [Alphaproteobacteria bacterium]